MESICQNLSFNVILKLQTLIDRQISAILEAFLARYPKMYENNHIAFKQTKNILFCLKIYNDIPDNIYWHGYMATLKLFIEIYMQNSFVENP